MPAILIVKKNGTIESANVKNYSDADLYRKAGLKNADGFAQHASWSAEIDGKNYTVNLYGKTEGTAGQENKYEFPPPVDSVLFFGSCILVNVLNNVVVDLQETEWAKIYEFLYGGFEELDDSDSDDDEDKSDNTDSNLPKTKEGYAKDGFIVGDNESEEESDEDEDEDEDEYVKPVKKVVVKTKAQYKTQDKINEKIQTKSPIQTQDKANENIQEKTQEKTQDKASKSNKKKPEPEVVQTNYMDCSSELMVEEYI